MKRRWRLNYSALPVLIVGWLVAGCTLAIVTMTPGDPHVRGDSDVQTWALLVWFGPYILAAFGAAVYALRRWLKSSSGWLVKRTWEPVREDLRESNR